MIMAKSCPKCGGDVYQERDAYGPYLACVQCGYYLTQAEEAALRYGRPLVVRHVKDAVAVGQHRR